jgi:hypothetical protein
MYDHDISRGRLAGDPGRARRALEYPENGVEELDGVRGPLFDTVVRLHESDAPLPARSAPTPMRIISDEHGVLENGSSEIGCADPSASHPSNTDDSNCAAASAAVT